jgi:hypothetical protein
MPRAADFRQFAFSTSRIDASGKDIGRKTYWKLYAIENIVRTIIHSVLSVQIGPDWWPVAVDPRIQKDVRRFRNQYARRPWHGTPGTHDIYYAGLADLGEIMRANTNLFVPVIPDIVQWVARIEQMRLPRNIVGHMNWPIHADRTRIDVFYSDVQALAAQLAAQGITLTIAQ